MRRPGISTTVTILLVIVTLGMSLNGMFARAAVPPPALCPSSSEVACDNFDSSPVKFLWTPYTSGSGTTSQTGGELVIPLPTATYSTSGSINGGYSSTCKLTGDFDIQVDYDIHTAVGGPGLWTNVMSSPAGNGVRIGLAVGDPVFTYTMERVSFGGPSTDYTSAPRDSYLVDKTAGPTVGYPPTTDLTGTLRLARTMDTLTGYYWVPATSTWAPVLPPGSPTTYAGVSMGPMSFGLNVSSNSSFPFTPPVEVAFDNFAVTLGTFTMGACVNIGVGPFPVPTLAGGMFSIPVTVPSGTWVVTFSWGDASTTTVGPVSGPTTVTGPHTYAVAGVYPVSLTISNTDAANVVLSRTITVTNPSVGGELIPVNKLALLFPFVGLASLFSLIVAATTATIFYVRRGKRRDEKQ